MTDSTIAVDDRVVGNQPPQKLVDGSSLVPPPVQPEGTIGIATTVAPVLPPKYLSDMLGQAESLLGYAAEVGICVEDNVRSGVLEARMAISAGGIARPEVDNLLTSLTALAVKVRPVTVESLKAYAAPKAARAAVSYHRNLALLFGIPIVIYSILTSVSSYVAGKINADVEVANGLVSKLRAELGPASPSTNQVSISAGGGVATSVPTAGLNRTSDQIWWGASEPPRGLSDKDVISDLQQFAANMRQIHGYTMQLSPFVLYFHPKDMRGKLELTPGLKVLLSQELTDKAEVYQDVRSFANLIQERVTVYYGAIATCILPVLYALLGAEAYLLRLYEDQIKNRTFIEGDRHTARYLIAGIGGLVVGLFTNITPGTTLGPFAIAFLVGYAVDVFFTFLEGLLQMFRRGPGNASAQGTPSKSSG